MNIGRCSITTAEIWGIYVRVRLAVDLVITNLMVESDSMCAVNFIGKPSIYLHASSSLISSIKEILTRLNKWRIKHIFRERNFCADVLAKMGHEKEPGITRYVHPPPWLKYHLLADIKE
ncbi:hypothetical protein AHAS_Ahas02G0179100 [Arachis hypogaea]